MKTRVLNELKTNFAKFGFKKDELEGVAEIIAGNLGTNPTDEDIHNAVSGAEQWATLMQKVGNRNVSETAKKFEGWIKPEQKQAEPAAGETLDAEGLKKLIAEEAEKIARAQVAPLIEAQKTERLNAVLKTDERLKAVPSTFVSRYALKDESELDALTGQIVSDYTAMKAEMFKNGDVAQPPKSNSGISGEIATDDEIKAIAAV